MSVSFEFNVQSFIPDIVQATKYETQVNQSNQYFLDVAEQRFGEPTVTKAPEFNKQTIS